MLSDVLPSLRAMTLVLASTSPRRSQLLAQMDLHPRIEAPRFDERTLVKADFASPSDFVMESARRKAQEVLSRLSGEASPPGLVIGADTVVVLNGLILEKPESPAHAEAMLAMLSGQTHQVLTGVALCAPDREAVFVESTEVTFAALPPAVIAAYVATGEPLDKAGAYGIQARAGSFVSSLRGDFYNVVGFPIHRFAMELRKMLHL